MGPSGSGKTTIIDLVIGLLRPESGEVDIDGVPMAQIDLRAWRQMVGYVPQETVLLHDSVVQNVTLGDPSISEARVIEVLEQAGAWGFVQALPEGLHTSVGERGGRLSGGQRQRIAIARALINRPQLLILDEATSALDPDSEAAIIATLQALKSRLTILAITHNSALADAADVVHHLSPGAPGCKRHRPAAGSAPVWRACPRHHLAHPRHGALHVARSLARRGLRHRAEP